MITEFMRVKLRSGIVGVVMEVLGSGDMFEVEIPTDEGSWDLLVVERRDIISTFKEKIVYL